MIAATTIFGRCVQAIDDCMDEASTHDGWRQSCVAAVFIQLAAELFILKVLEPELTLSDVARRLVRETSGQEMIRFDDDDFWDDHPSLTNRERNPNLR